MSACSPPRRSSRNSAVHPQLKTERCKRLRHSASTRSSCACAMPATAETIVIAIAISRALLHPVRARGRARAASCPPVCACVDCDGCAQARSMRGSTSEGRDKLAGGLELLWRFSGVCVQRGNQIPLLARSWCWRTSSPKRFDPIGLAYGAIAARFQRRFDLGRRQQIYLGGVGGDQECL